MHRTGRFIDTGQFLMAFADEVLVTCTGCGAAGVVRAAWSPYTWNAAFKCGNCRLALSSGEGHWVGAARLNVHLPSTAKKSPRH